MIEKIVRQIQHSFIVAREPKFGKKSHKNVVSNLIKNRAADRKRRKSESIKSQKISIQLKMSHSHVQITAIPQLFYIYTIQMRKKSCAVNANSANI